jgi:hypothetical protein
MLFFYFTFYDLRPFAAFDPVGPVLNFKYQNYVSTVPNFINKSHYFVSKKGGESTQENNSPG